MHLALNDFLGNANDALASGESMLSGYEAQLAAYGRSLKPGLSAPTKLLLLVGALGLGWYLYKKS